MVDFGQDLRLGPLSETVTGQMEDGFGTFAG